jgi:hypothetical protein
MGTRHAIPSSRGQLLKEHGQIAGSEIELSSQTKKGAKKWQLVSQD